VGGRPRSRGLRQRQPGTPGAIGVTPFKSFIEDSIARAWRQQLWRDKLAAVFTNSAGRSGDKLMTLVQFAVFAAQHGMVLVPLAR
jgi:multimeric flavodoxin WrbA